MTADDNVGTYPITIGDTRYPVLVSRSGTHHLYIGTVRAENYLSSHDGYNATIQAAQEHYRNRQPDR